MENPANSGVLAGRKPTARSRVSNNADLLPGIDGRRAISRRLRDITSAIVADMGGIDKCSESRVQLIRRFSAAAVLSELLEAQLANGAEINISEHALLTSSMVRVAQRIGINRLPKNVTPELSDYLEAKALKEPDTEDAA